MTGDVTITPLAEGDLPAPPAVRSSAQFAGLCPANATCLRHDLAVSER